MRRYGLGDDYNKRVPSMYFFYRKELQEAYSKDDSERVEYLIQDLPKDIYLALVREGEIETSISQAREQIHIAPDEIVRATMIVLQDNNLLAEWPKGEDLASITSAVLDIVATDIGRENQ
ncbi:hypothetical protein N8602_00010 [bacterium]|nr:hypothetical protein [bacterium]